MSDASPPPIAYAVPTSLALPPARRRRAAVVPALCLLAAWVVGAVTNGVSACVSRTYFDVVVGAWYGGSMTWGDVVFQGLLESTAFGVLLAFVLTLVYLIATACRLPLRDVVVALSVGVAIALACWLVGGALGVAWTMLSPTSFRNTFDVSAKNPTDLARWGFVGGSIWGVYVGGLATAVVSGVVIHQRWCRHRDRCLDATNVE